MRLGNSLSLSLPRFKQMPDYLRYYYSCPASLIGDYGYDRVRYLKTREVEVNCDHLVNEYLIVSGICTSFF
jgi:hypothetical protein